MKRIPLTQGQFAIVDDEDFGRLNTHKWQASWNPSTNAFYATRKHTEPNGRRITIYMHREILRPTATELVDHRYGNTLDNRKSELRLCSGSQNHANRIRPPTGAAGFCGVYKRKNKDRWYASIKVQGKYYYLGDYASPELASEAYSVAKVRHFGEFSNHTTNPETRPLQVRGSGNARARLARSRARQGDT